MMQLPGGLLQDGRLRRDFRFRTVTGELERLFSESGHHCRSLPEQISVVLEAGLDEVAGMPADASLVRSLSAGDRLFLILQLETLVYPEPRWVTAKCSGCGELIQFLVAPGDFPVVEAGPGYPSMPVCLHIGDLDLRVPTGADEEAVAQEGDEQRGLQLLLSRVLSREGGEVDISLLTQDDLDQINRLLDNASPHVGTAAQVACPHCGEHQEIAIDPCDWLAAEGDALDRDIHTLAFHYHWSEREILQLPRRRRERYLELIDRDLGKYRADDHIHGSHGGGW
jgi:hypothetical protein